jgi:putative SOS response-associated peptidase YedK
MWNHPADHRLFAFAGLWARNKPRVKDPRDPGSGPGPEAGNETHSFTIVTGPPNELVAPIHDRMPVVLDRSLWASWLDPALPADKALELLGVPPVEDWQAEPVSTWVNAADHDDEQCIAAITEPVPEPPKQGSLF